MSGARVSILCHGRRSGGPARVCALVAIACATWALAPVAAWADAKADAEADAQAAARQKSEYDLFEEKLARVDRALKTNPTGVPTPVLESCRNRRNFALKQARARQTTRAIRSLRFCFDILMIPESGPMPGDVVVPDGPTEAEMAASAAAEIEKALALEPNLERGRDIYAECAMCHEPEGWGLVAGSTPQIAGQHRTVLIKQLADIRSGHRTANLMLPYASAEAIGGPQAIADVTGYIDSLEMTVDNGKGDGTQLKLGKQVYASNCMRCHGVDAEGNAEEFIPRLQAQHYKYLLRQFEAIRSGKRHNRDPDMVAQIKDLTDEEVHAVLDYVSRLQPPIELQAPEGWYNPDFPKRSGP